MKREHVGHSVKVNILGFSCQAFVPGDLPPDPPLDIDGEIRKRLDEALVALGRLDSLGSLLPDPYLFLYTYVRKEAVLSSQIEGSQSSLSDLLRYEIDQTPGVPLDDVREVSNYVAAMDYGLEKLRAGSRLTRPLIREIHGILLRSGRGSQKSPGKFRTQSNWIGGSRPDNAIYVPPPHRLVPKCMRQLDGFLNDVPESTSTLIKAALAHVQFETIHPFLDGNGRVGRLLIPLLLCSEGILTKPMLYLSLHFKVRRDEYYGLLQRVRLEGDWEAWLRFFAEGVRETAQSAVETAQRLMHLFDRDRSRIEETAGRRAGSTLRLHRALQGKPLLSAPQAVKETGLSLPAVNGAFGVLQDQGIVTEITGKQRDRLFSYAEYVRILNEGTEL